MPSPDPSSSIRSRLHVLLSPATLLSAVVLILAAALVILAGTRSEQDVFTAEGFKALAVELGWIGPAAYVGILALTVVVSQLPGVPLAVAAGMLWGTLPGVLLSLAGGLLGSVLAYFIGRRLGRDSVYLLTGRQLSFRPGLGRRAAALFIGVTRLIPVLPFDLVSYAAGIAAVPFPLYLAVTAAGMTPPTLLIVHLGSSLVMGFPGAIAISAVAAATVLLLPVILHRSRRLKLDRYIRWE